jgi:hypothetical protein
VSGGRRGSGGSLSLRGGGAGSAAAAVFGAVPSGHHTPRRHARVVHTEATLCFADLMASEDAKKTGNSSGLASAAEVCVARGVR